MRNQARAFLLFYKRIAFSALFFAFLLSLLTGSLSFAALGVSYFFIMLVFHYVMFEHLYKQQYFFYYHLGLSRKKLWILSVAFSTIIAITFLIL
jgi:hypothetical protein